MSGVQAKNLELSARQRRILFRSWHRGMREMDLLLRRFANAKIGNLCDKDLDDYERLLEAQDRDIFGWVSCVNDDANPSNGAVIARDQLCLRVPARSKEGDGSPAVPVDRTSHFEVCAPHGPWPRLGACKRGGLGRQRSFARRRAGASFRGWPR